MKQLLSILTLLTLMSCGQKAPESNRLEMCLNDNNLAACQALGVDADDDGANDTPVVTPTYNMSHISYVRTYVGYNKLLRTSWEGEFSNRTYFYTKSSSSGYGSTKVEKTYKYKFNADGTGGEVVTTTTYVKTNSSWPYTYTATTTSITDLFSWYLQQPTTYGSAKLYINNVRHYTNYVYGN